MVAEGEGRKDAATHRLSGRGPDNRLVHFTPDLDGVERPARRHGHRRDHVRRPAPPGRRRAGAGRAPYALRRRLGGAHTPRPPRRPVSSLGMPALGVPAPLPDAPACR